ncbi:MAG: VWA domain-containing protein, partial [Planctomycetota bacterium]|nr:VWA domain-containing protein [Planctomycetota bacterium]
MPAQLELRLTVDRELPARVAVLTDTSGSMGLKDSVAQASSLRCSRLAAARAFVEGPLAPLDKHASVSRYRFDWRLELEDGRAEPAGATRLAEALLEVARREPDLQAIVLLSDGNDTAGDHGARVAPLLRARGVPVYPVVFGGDDAPRMGEVHATGGGTYVRLGDELRLSATLTARNLETQTVRAVLYEKGVARPLGV